MAHGSGGTRRFSLCAAVTFAIAAVAGVVGGRVSGQLTPGLVLFAMLVAAGMILSYWVDRSARADSGKGGHASGAAPDVPAAGERQAPTIQTGIASGPGSVVYMVKDGNIVWHRDQGGPGDPGGHAEPSGSGSAADGPGGGG